MNSYGVEPNPGHPDIDDNGPSVVMRTLEDQEKHALEAEVLYNGDLGRNFSGGKGTGNAYMGMGAIRANYNLERGLRWKGARAFLHIQGTHGKDMSPLVGDKQVTSNIEAPLNTVKIYEAWLQQSFLDDRFSVLGGLFDLNSEFYLTETSTLFLNSSFGIGADLAQGNDNGRGPSIFPTPTLGLRARVQLPQDFYAQAAVFDGATGRPGHKHGTQVKYDPPNEGHFLVTEFGWQPGAAKEDPSGKVALGLWKFTSPYAHLTAVNAAGEAAEATNYGAYVIGEKKFSELLSGFARFGWANPDVNRFQNNFSAGAVFTGLVPGRAEDKLGLAFTRVANGRAYRESVEAKGEVTDKAETAFELTYSAEIVKGVSLQPDFQYIKNPSTDPSVPSALAGFLRLKLSWGY